MDNLNLERQNTLNSYYESEVCSLINEFEDNYKNLDYNNDDETNLDEDINNKILDDIIEKISYNDINIATTTTEMITTVSLNKINLNNYYPAIDYINFALYSKFLINHDENKPIQLRVTNYIESFNTYAIKKNDKIILKILKHNNKKFIEFIESFENKIIKFIKEKNADNEIDYESFYNNGQVELRLSKRHYIFTRQNGDSMPKLEKNIDIVKILPTQGILNLIIVPIVEYMEGKYKINYIVPQLELVYNKYCPIHIFKDKFKYSDLIIITN